MRYNLDAEEQEILAAFEADLSQPIPNAAEEIEKHQSYAAETLCHLNRDVLQQLALSEGMSYQAFIADILHKFASGRYIDKQVALTNMQTTAL